MCTSVHVWVRLNERICACEFVQGWVYVCEGIYVHAHMYLSVHVHVCAGVSVFM